MLFTVGKLRHQVRTDFYWVNNVNFISGQLIKSHFDYWKLIKIQHWNQKLVFKNVGDSFCKIWYL